MQSTLFATPKQVKPSLVVGVVADLLDRWHDECAPIPTQRSITSAQRLIDTLPPSSPPPSVAPLESLGIRIEWVCGERDAAIEIDADGMRGAFVETYRGAPGCITLEFSDVSAAQCALVLGRMLM